MAKLTLKEMMTLLWEIQALVREHGAACVYCSERSFIALPPHGFIKLLTPDGKTPQPPQPAYQQLSGGVPIASFTTDELIMIEGPLPEGKHYALTAAEVCTWRTAMDKSETLPSA